MIHDRMTIIALDLAKDEIITKSYITDSVSEAFCNFIKTMGDRYFIYDCKPAIVWRDKTH